MLCIIHQKIEKDNDKLSYFQHNLSDSGIFQQKKEITCLGEKACLWCFVRPVRQVRPVRHGGSVNSARS